MKSLNQISDWHNQLEVLNLWQEAPDLMREPNRGLIDRVMEDQRDQLDEYRRKMMRAIDTPDSLREYLEFDEIDESLYASLASLLYSLLERDDISEIDQVIAQIIWFVRMCPHFYKLRLAKTIGRLEEKERRKQKKIAA